MAALSFGETVCCLNRSSKFDAFVDSENHYHCTTTLDVHANGLYKKGKENIVVDALSRRTESVGESGKLMTFSLPIHNWLESIRTENASNPRTQELIKRVEEGEALGPWKVQGEILYFKNKIYLDKDSELVDLIMEQFHCSTHEGFHKTIQRVRSNFYFQGLRDKI